MSDMGFPNKQANLEALVATNGNIDFAVERLLNMLNWIIYLIYVFKT